MRLTIRAVAVSVLFGFLSGCGGCGEQSRTTPTSKLCPPGSGSAIKLDPLPEPPALKRALEKIYADRL